MEIAHYTDTQLSETTVRLGGGLTIFFTATTDHADPGHTTPGVAWTSVHRNGSDRASYLAHEWDGAPAALICGF